MRPSTFRPELSSDLLEAESLRGIYASALGRVRARQAAEHARNHEGPTLEGRNHEGPALAVRVIEVTVAARHPGDPRLRKVKLRIPHVDARTRLEVQRVASHQLHKRGLQLLAFLDFGGVED